jgi:hypothetical protein
MCQKLKTYDRTEQYSKAHHTTAYQPNKQSFQLTMTFKTLSAKVAQQVDKELMSTGGFSIDQLVS